MATSHGTTRPGRDPTRTRPSWVWRPLWQVGLVAALIIVPPLALTLDAK